MSCRATARVVAASTLVLLVTACGDSRPASSSPKGKDQAAGDVACVSADTTPVSLAVREFITKASPTPQRFLNAVGTDSALPEAGFKVLQEKGPTYFYSSDPKGQQQVKDKLAVNGPYATLLVVYHGQVPSEGGTVVDVKLGGHYVGGALDGQAAPTKRFTVRCDSTSWHLTGTADAPGT